MKFFIWTFFENQSRKLEFLANLTRITGTLNLFQSKIVEKIKRQLYV